MKSVSMKKFLMLLLSTIILLCVVVGLSACSFGSNPPIDPIDEPFVEYRYFTEDGEDILYERLPINEGDTFVDIPGPELPGYEFKGWYCINTSKDGHYVEGDALPKKGGMKVYAYFDSLPCTVTFISQGTVIYEKEYWSRFKIYDFEYGQGGSNLFPWKDDVKWWLEEKYATRFEDDYFVWNGLFLDEECTQPLEKGYVFIEDTNVYCDWYHLPIELDVDGNGAAGISIGDMYEYRACGNLPHTITLPTTDEQGNIYTEISGIYIGQEVSNVVEIVIPKNVTTIGKNAFNGCSIETLKMESVTSIGEYAFENCAHLSSVTMPKVTTVGKNAFNGCSSLETVSMESATSIGEYAFVGCTKLSSVTMPKVTTVGKNAFNGCSSLETVSMESITSIDEGMFKGCTKLSSVTMPKVTTVAKTAFNGCSSLETVSMESITSIDEGMFKGFTKLSSITMPKVTTVGKNAFDGCSSLETLSMESATSIGEYAFVGCTKLSSVTMPKVTTIGKNAFNGCSSLETVSMESVTSIGEYAFENCIELSSVTIPYVKTIGKNAFNGCSSLESLRAGRLEAIESGAFKNCESLDFFLLYCATGLTIADDAFSGCGYIDEIYCENDASYWEEISGTKPDGTVYFYSYYEQSIEKYLQTKTLLWHYDENDNPEFWIHINDTLKGKTLTSKKENARVILTDYTWELLCGAKQNGMLAIMMQDEDLRTAIENAETKEDLDAYFTSKLNVVDATLVFGTDGTVTIYNGKFPEGYKYEYIEINDRLIMTDPDGVETLVGEFYFDTDGHLYEIQPFSMEGMESFGNGDEGFANVRFDYYEVIEKIN